MHGNKTNRELKEEFDAEVRGHDEAKKGLINLFNQMKLRYYQRYIHLAREYELITPHKLLLIGPSGNGKTHLVEVGSRLAGVNLVKVDATVLSPTGNGQGINSDGLRKLIRNSAKNLVNTHKYYHSLQGTIDQTVVFIDEIDKLSRPCDSTGNWNRHVQESFLTMFDDKEEFSGVSFIFAGAFTGIDEQIKPKSSKSIGFTMFKDETLNDNDVDWDEEVIKYGLVPELVGRINGIYKIDTLTKEDYSEILYNILIPKKQEELLYYHCTDFTIKEADAEKLINKAIKSGQGVRSLKRELDKLVADIKFYYEDVHEEHLLLEHMIDRYGSQSKE